MYDTFSITCIDTLHHEKTVVALQRTIETLRNKVNLTKVYWFSDVSFPSYCSVPVVWIKIPKITEYVKEYNNITMRLCPMHVDTDFNFIIHADGYAVNPDAWTNDFLKYDYIGARWIMYNRNNVGNGGFSLRSRKLYNAMHRKHVEGNDPIDLKYDEYPYNEFLAEEQERNRVVPEDTLICRYYRSELEQKYDVKFCPDYLADRFSIEGTWNTPWMGRSLGFHGRWVAHYYGATV